MVDACPGAANTRPAVRCAIDQTYEVLRLDLWEIGCRRRAYLQAIAGNSATNRAILLMYAMSVETVDEKEKRG